MPVHDMGLFHSDGRLRGSYLYLLLCRDDGPVYVKVGISDRPTERLGELRHGCPVTPHQFCFLEVRSRKRALLMERAMKIGLANWSAHGEWFRVPMEEQVPFNDVIRGTLLSYQETGWPCRWERVSVAAIVAHGERQMRGRYRLERRRGPAYRDAAADGACKSLDMALT